jgi:hypothetical protein
MYYYDSSLAFSPVSCLHSVNTQFLVSILQAQLFIFKSFSCFSRLYVALYCHHAVFIKSYAFSAKQGLVPTRSHTRMCKQESVKEDMHQVEDVPVRARHKT